MPAFLPLQKEFRRISALLESQCLLTTDSIQSDQFLKAIDASAYFITIHDVEYYRPICVNQKLKLFYGFDRSVLQGLDHFYYLKTMHISTYYTLIESMAFFRNDQPGYLNLTYKLLNASKSWETTIGASRALIRD